MNRRIPATGSLAVLVVLLVITLLAPGASAATKKNLPVTHPVLLPPAVAVDDTGVPGVALGGYPVPTPGPVDPLEPSLHDAMRHLWMDHIVWSRVVTMSVFSELKGQSDYEARLATNVYDMRDLFLPYVGKEAAATFADLFMRHVTLASEVLTAYKSGNETAIRSVTYDWYRNADEISAYLCKINPSWSYAEMSVLWRTHLDTVVLEALDYKNEDYSGDVMCYDAAQDHVFVLADYLSDNLSPRK